MASHGPAMPVPEGDLTPAELRDAIASWAEQQGYEAVFRLGRNEYGIIVLHAPDGAVTTTTIPNAHRGRRLRRDQIRYVVKKVNTSWRE